MEVEETYPGALKGILTSQKEPERLADGFGGQQGPAEGPLWWKEGGYLLFSDIHNSRRMKYEEGKGVSVEAEGTNNANGLTRDRQGRLVMCHHFTRSVSRLESDGSTTVIANRYHGMRLNRPNDVVVKSDGAIYFSDPPPRPPLTPWEHTAELDHAGFYRVSPDLGEINLVSRDFVNPNGLCFSPDEKILYLNDTRLRIIRAYDVGPNGMLDISPPRLFIQMTGEKRGGPDGMKVDVEGNVYCTGPGGVWIMNSEGKHLGIIRYEGTTSQFSPTISNMAFGDDDMCTLYMTAWDSLHRIRLGIPGVPAPRGQL